MRVSEKHWTNFGIGFRECFPEEMVTSVRGEE